MAQLEVVTFPRLAGSELVLVKPWNAARDYADGETLFRAGQADIDLYTVKSGQMEIQKRAGLTQVVHPRFEISFVFRDLSENHPFLTHLLASRKPIDERAMSARTFHAVDPCG
jgi:hypothetical protein